VAVLGDEPSTRHRLTRILESARYRTTSAPDGETGLRIVHEHQPDLVLIDLSRSRPDSLDVCRRLRADPRTAGVSLLVLAPRRSAREMIAALEAGADDFLGKPARHFELLARVDGALRSRGLTRRMEEARDIVASLANAVEAKDPSIDGHCRRLAYRAARLAAYVGMRGDELEAVAFGAILHDIGKIAISELVLNKPGALDMDELERMQEHPEIGGRICAPLRAARRFAPIIRHHHERWDGRGYPSGLAGEGIPLGARIVSIADAYDAITFGRPYRRARSHEEAAEELQRCAGSQFDPALVPLFLDETERLASGLPPTAELPLATLIERHIPVAPRPVRAA
jgi:putative two-component system response regulator